MSAAGWETRWERLWEQGREDELGPKGREYIEAKYGESYEQQDVDYDYEDYNDYEFDIEY